jgi:hypothetical protein
MIVENTPNPDLSRVAHESAAAQAEAPPMPVVRDTLWRSPNLIPVVGQRYTLGWQDAKKEGPCFMVARTGVMGDKVLDRFPLTEDGWARAWAALVKLDAVAAQAVAKTIGEWRAAQAAKMVETERQAQVAALEARALGSLRGVAYLGGYVPESAITPGWLYDVLFLEDCLVVLAYRQAKVLAEVSYIQVEDVAIGGPGLVKTGGGFVGGGFGMGGAVEGMAIAAVLNALTTRTSVKTIVRIQGTACELFLLHTKLAPAQLRIAMSRPLAAIRSTRATQATRGTEHEAPVAAPSPVQELTKLAGMLEKGLLTREEFDLMKAKLIGPPTI